jgi:hypothetical protein
MLSLPIDHESQRTHERGRWRLSTSASIALDPRCPPTRVFAGVADQRGLYPSQHQNAAQIGVGNVGVTRRIFVTAAARDCLRQGIDNDQLHLAARPTSFDGLDGGDDLISAARASRVALLLPI